MSQEHWTDEEIDRREARIKALEAERDEARAENERMREALWAAVDVIPRWTETERVPNERGIQLRCVFCKGHNGGECGVSHTNTCIVGRALRLCREVLSYHPTLRTDVAPSGKAEPSDTSPTNRPACLPSASASDSLPDKEQCDCGHSFHTAECHGIFPGDHETPMTRCGCVGVKI